MSYPEPTPGLVIRYSFLWRAEATGGREEGVKVRRCAVVLVTADERGDKIVLVLPVTHFPPSDPTLAVELPAGTKARLGLDAQRSWIVLTEANRFIWPGPDVRPLPRRESGIAYGHLPRALFNEVRDKFARAIAARLATVTRRSE